MVIVVSCSRLWFIIKMNYITKNTKKKSKKVLVIAKQKKVNIAGGSKQCANDP